MSIDVAIGGVIMSASIAKLWDVDMPIVVYIALFLCIWMIYTLDHLLDAKKAKEIPTMKRHKFHQQYGTILFYVLFMTAMTSLSVLFFLPPQILLYGGITAGIIAGYFLLTWWLKVFVAKEILIAVLYSSGVCLAPMVLQSEFSLNQLFIYVQVALVAFNNLLLFSFYDSEDDLKDGYSSWATINGALQTKRFLTFSMIVSLMIIVLMLILGGESEAYFVFQISLFFMILVLGALFIGVRKLQSEYWFRLLGDGVFMFPGVMLLL